ncbi:hypothetical protein BU25DRAFT_217608 [Macroventuria anomochaeta]|uniref:Uncharacterized protein n=1 Tax=Macroventuria anomochaeta TaxID=301207 RepID=A0ACB6RJ93_9PLEO|nr:uncharacterized protein BU25DRAFT_217608 [Macroventuria anomochaeta]KAF2622025.1 hypothetical protein BU25DRAFT_217608 [Macroventuria anomochaeta]
MQSYNQQPQCYFTLASSSMSNPHRNRNKGICLHALLPVVLALVAIRGRDDGGVPGSSVDVGVGGLDGVGGGWADVLALHRVERADGDIRGRDCSGNTLCRGGGGGEGGRCRGHGGEEGGDGDEGLHLVGGCRVM